MISIRILQIIKIPVTYFPDDGETKAPGATNATQFFGLRRQKVIPTLSPKEFISEYSLRFAIFLRAIL